MFARRYGRGYPDADSEWDFVLTVTTGRRDRIRPVKTDYKEFKICGLRDRVSTVVQVFVAEQNLN